MFNEYCVNLVNQISVSVLIFPSDVDALYSEFNPAAVKKSMRNIKNIWI